MFTEEEFEELFGGQSEPLPPRSQRMGRAPRLLGLFVASAMALGGVLTLADSVATSPDFRTPAEIEAAAWAEVNDSPLGWLVEDIVLSDIERPNVGAFVTNNPPDGVITLDFRPWNEDRLDELIDHEICLLYTSPSPRDRG